MKKKNLSFFVLLFLPTLMVALIIILVDPFFHFHAPFKGEPYLLSEERYQNDGIVRHFAYDALITGSSTSQNFKTTDINRLWNVDSVKVPFAGASFKEQDSIVRTAISTNSDLKMVIRGIDINGIDCDKDEMLYDDYPEYLYDSNPLNDYDYLYNKDVAELVGKMVIRLIKGEGPESFDDYSNWNEIKSFGGPAVLSTFTRVDEAEEEAPPFSEEELARIRDNITQNIIETALENPDIDFYVFLTPPSVCFWDAIIRTGCYDNVMNELKYTYELLLEVENIKLYSFFDKIEITGDLDNYMDTLHYSEDINTYICECMNRGEGLMTRDNYAEYIERVREIYENFDYDSIF